MTDRADREMIAEVIMGWHKEENLCLTGKAYWASADRRFTTPVEWWCLESGIEQAMQIVDAIKEKPFSVRLRFMRALEDQARDCGKAEQLPASSYPQPFWWFMFIADRPRVIFKAAVAVAKAMKGEGS